MKWTCPIFKEAFWWWCRLIIHPRFRKKLFCQVLSFVKCIPEFRPKPEVSGAAATPPPTSKCSYRRPSIVLAFTYIPVPVRCLHPTFFTLFLTEVNATTDHRRPSVRAVTSMFWWTPCSYLLPVFLLGTAKVPSTIMFYNFLITLIIFVIILNFFIIF